MTSRPMKKRYLPFTLFASTLALGLIYSSTANAGNYGSVPTVDGYLGAEWGAPTASVSYDPNAAESNFGTPGTSDDVVSYDIYLRSDSNYVYGLLQATPAHGGTFDPNLLFANVYFSTSLGGGSNLGFELGNNNAFVPGGAGPFVGLDAYGFAFDANSANEAMEFAIPWSYLLNDPQGVGFTKISASNTALQLRLSQAFSYSVAGGSTYGDNRLGLVNYDPSSVPDSGSTCVLLGVALLVVGGLAARRQRVTA